MKIGKNLMDNLQRMVNPPFAVLETSTRNRHSERVTIINRLGAVLFGLAHLLFRPDRPIRRSQEPAAFKARSQIPLGSHPECIGYPH